MALFVVQKHKATVLHYDFRLEIGGVLKSWAVPRGPSTDPREKRLAVPTEDHPLQYAEFEGVIPKGEPGAGTVLVWDTGTYENRKIRGGRTVAMLKALEEGHLVVWLRGKKLKGGYALTRIKKGSREDWLLVKMKDGEAHTGSDLLTKQPRSVLSGRTMEQITDEVGWGNSRP